VIKEPPRPSLSLVAPELPEGLLQQGCGLQTFIGPQELLQGFSPSSVRFSRFDSRVYFCPLMYERAFPASRPYSRLRTVSNASLRCRITWNLSYKIAACGPFFRVDFSKAFHMSITARRIPPPSCPQAIDRIHPGSPQSGPGRQTKWDAAAPDR